ncbi:unnamed protein product [Kuraishia capsulata CBS 1993]|uniref:Nudix hydrolase domain-containing protein n=1 Tax=Kuraishia capsulata CBS 1993 TaxID=1382522 RepID=W6MGI5_9ASCO|nr:uncharacterized protein KUCA_T00000888001 [Kuraishia capsulata CBS 1993]CDK24921.1 unnamed protein product [Kuraishia capsulata CBS 1993]
MDKIRYLAPDGKERDWEMTSRKTRLEGALVDGVGILAILKSGSEPQVLLQKQFRPPVEGICIEIPAGLIDPAESITECALRELKEETGYKGSVVEQSGVMFNDPGFTNTNMSMVIVNIDLEDPENQNPVPELEENEFIETFAVPLATLDTELAELEKAGYRVDARLFNVAIGLKIAREFKLF